MKIQNSIDSICGRLLPAVAGVLMTVVAARADYQSTVLNDHPLAYYPLNSTVDPTGTTATDLSGNGNNGTYNGTDPQYNSVPGPSSYITNALMFDGLSSYMDLSTGSNPSILNFGGPITMEAWVQPANTTEGPADIIAKGYDSSQGYNEITLRANAGDYYGGTYSSSNNVQGASGGQQTTNWAYVVCTYDGTNWMLYVNGVSVQTNADAVGAIKFSDPWAIGDGTADGASRFFQGNITQVALYTNALSPYRVLNHFLVAEINVSASNAVPFITAQPQPQSAYVGGSVTFSVAYLSAFPATNQWYKNGVPMGGQTNTSLTLNNIQAGDATNYSVTIGNINGTTNSATVTLALLMPGNSLQWSSSANSGVWDTTNSANWINLSNNQQVVFNPSDQVLFDDTVGVPTNVAISGTVAPSVLTINASTNNFSLTDGGSGQISGPGSLVKQGASTLTLNVSGNFTGPATISGGTVLTAGNNTLASVSAITITNGGTLDFDGNTLPGGKSVTVSGAGVGGEGALYNRGSDFYNNVLNITLIGDTTFGGSGRWDWTGGLISGPHKLTVNWSTNGGYGEWNSVTIATNVGDIELATGKLGIKNMGATFGNPAGNFIVDSGTELDWWTGDSGYAKNFHVLSTGKMQILTGTRNFSGNVTLENGANFNAFYGSGSYTINGTVTLNGVAHIALGDADFVFTNIISGPGGFVWDAYNHQMILSASNTYSGPTVIGNGEAVALTNNGSISHSSFIFFGGNDPTVAHMDVTGRPDQTLTLAGGQTLAGIGGINGSLVVSVGAILSPSGTNTTIGITTSGTNSVGTIAASANITLNGTTIIKLNGSGTNDVVQAGGNIIYGGTLNLVNISGSPLAAGNTFQIFSAATYTGSFANITPTTPGAGLAWNTNQLSSGIVSVVTGSSQPVIGSTKVSGGNLIFSGSGGTANGTYYVLSSTNVATPLANWTPLSTNTFDGSGNFNVSNAIVPGVPHQFYLLKTP